MTTITCKDLTVEGDISVTGKLTLGGDIVPQSGMDVCRDLSSSAGLCTSLFAINALGGIFCKEGCRVIGNERLAKALPAIENTWSVNWVKNEDGSRKLVFIIDQTPIFHVNTVDTTVPLNLNWDYTEGLNVFGVTVASVFTAACVAAAGVRCYSAAGEDPQRATRTSQVRPINGDNGDVVSIELEHIDHSYAEDGVGEPNNVIPPEGGLAGRKYGVDENGNATVQIPENFVQGTQDFRQSQDLAAMCVQPAEFGSFQRTTIHGAELPRDLTPEVAEVTQALVQNNEPIIQLFVVDQEGPILINEDLSAAGTLEASSSYYITQPLEFQGGNTQFYDGGDEKFLIELGRDGKSVVYKPLSAQAFRDYSANNPHSPYGSGYALHDMTYTYVANSLVVQFDPLLEAAMSSMGNRIGQVPATPLMKEVVRANTEEAMRIIDAAPESSRAELINESKRDICSLVRQYRLRVNVYGETVHEIERIAKKEALARRRDGSISYTDQQNAQFEKSRKAFNEQYKELQAFNAQVLARHRAFYEDFAKTGALPPNMDIRDYAIMSTPDRLLTMKLSDLKVPNRYAQYEELNKQLQAFNARVLAMQRAGAGSITWRDPEMPPPLSPLRNGNLK